MAFTLTPTAQSALSGVTLEPQIVLEIEGVSTRFGVRVISKKILIGDEGLFIGDEWTIGGLRELEDQSDIISLDGTSTSLRQQLQADKGLASAVTNFQVALVDLNLEATRLVSPGVTENDVLGRKARLYLGVSDSVSFPDDFVPFFIGICEEIQAKPGEIVLTLAHPEQKKRQELFTKVETKLLLPLNSSSTTLRLDEVEGFIHVPTLGLDQGLRTYVKINEELIEYRAKGTESGELTSLVRGQLGTVAASHDAEASVTTFYRLTGNVVDLAVKLMLSSDSQSHYLSQAVTSVGFIDSQTTIPNALFFRGLDLATRYGVTVGDLVTFSQPTPTVERVIEQIIKREDGTVLILGGAPLLTEIESTLTASFRSRYNVFGNGGLGLAPDEVDVEEFERVKGLFLSSFEVDLYLHDTENVRELIERELLAPAGAYSLPRKGRISVGVLTSPIPGSTVTILSRENIKNPSRLKTTRTINSNFVNTVIVKMDERLDDPGEFAKGLVVRSEDSANRIKIGTKALVIEARGLRSSALGETLATQAATRRLRRFEYAAETIESVAVLFKTGFALELGDVVLLDPEGLNLIDSKSGSRAPQAKLYEITSRAVDLRTGDVVLTLLDTNFSTARRYGLISPASRVKVGLSQTQFAIESLLGVGTNEAAKWLRLLSPNSRLGVRVRSKDFTQRSAEAEIVSIVGNVVTTTDLGFTPQPGDVMELPSYSSALTTATVKALYGFISSADAEVFGDGEKVYSIL